MKDIRLNPPKINLPEPEEKQGTSINALPEYEIRTMKDDLAKLGLEKLEKEAISAQASPAPDELPIIDDEKIKKPSLPSIEELIIKQPPEPRPQIQKLEIPEPPHFAKALENKPKPAIPLPPAPKKKKSKSILLPILIIIIIILAGIGGIFYWQNRKNPPLPPIEENEEPELSESLIPVEKTKIISLDNQTSVSAVLQQEALSEESPGTIKRIAILKNETEFLSLIDLFQELEINIPSSVLTEIKENYTLVLYSQNGKSHLGLVAEIKNISNLQEQLRLWEQTMVNDLKNFFLSEEPGLSATNEFQDNIYNNVSIRYINFPEPNITIDYALTDNLFILLTSKESMYEIIDRIVDNL